MPRFASVRTRLLAAISALVFAISLSYTVWFPLAEYGSLTRALEIKAETTGRLSALSLSASLDFGDQEGARTYLEGVAQDPDVAWVALYDARGAKLAEAGGEPPPLRQREGMVLEESGGVMYLERPILAESGPGRLQLGLSTNTIRQSFVGNVAMAGLMGLLVTLFGIAAAWYLAFTIGTPLQAMALVARRVAEGRLDTEAPVVDSDDEIGQLAESLQHMLATLRALENHVVRMAEGDLTRPTGVEGDLAAAMNRMLANQRELVARISQTSSDIRSSSSQILSGALQLEQTATEQAAVVEQTTRTMESLLVSAQQISHASTNVLQHAERTHANSQLIAERISELAQHTQRISVFLDVIREIANKTDLLALNAALEGTRAGEAGRGFSLVASQMQRLTVNVMDSVEDIKGLTADIREATGATVLATEDATKRALSTEQAARQINLIIQQQRSGTEQANTSMAEISEAIRQSVEASSQSARAASALAELSSTLATLVGRFELER